MELLNVLLNVKFFGLRIIDPQDTLELILRFVFNLFFLFVLIRYIYYTTTRRKDFLVTYMLLSTIVFLLLFLLESVKLQVGVALGLFAIFGILRYRTSQIPIREMTYLFLVIGLSVINALANKKISYAELLFTNFMVLFIAWGLEKVWLMRHETKKNIIYEKIDLIKPEKRQELIKDIEERTGLKISRIEVGRIDFMRDSARLRIYYYEDENIPNSADNEDYFGQDDDDDD